ncbi:MAG: LamG domain-containing protein [Geminicoccaceae bacterium]
MPMRIKLICALFGGVAFSCWPVFAKDRLAPFPWKPAHAAQIGDGVLDTSATGYLRVDHDPALDLTADFTIELRASFEHFHGHQEIIRKASAWDQDGFVFKWHDHQLQLVRGGPGGDISTGSGAYSVVSVPLDGLEPNRMYDLAVVKRDNAVIFFVDGKAVGAGSIEPMVATTADMTISTPWADGHLAGQVDELRIWRHARHARTIATSVDRRFEGQEPYLLALYRFDDPGDTAGNASRPSQHGDLVGRAALVRYDVRPASLARH